MEILESVLWIIAVFVCCILREQSDSKLYIGIANFGIVINTINLYRSIPL